MATFNFVAFFIWHMKKLRRFKFSVFNYWRTDKIFYLKCVSKTKGELARG